MGLNDFLKSMFGSKSDRDLKKLRPIVQKIKQVYPTVEALSNDELRARVTAIRQEIQDDVQPLRDEIAKIKVEVEELDFEKRQPLWDKVDKLQKEVLDRIQAKLDEVLPEVFAIVKDTARRFAQNETTSTANWRLKVATFSASRATKPLTTTTGWLVATR